MFFSVKGNAAPLVEYEIDQVPHCNDIQLAPTYHGGAENYLTASNLTKTANNVQDLNGTGECFGSWWGSNPDYTRYFQWGFDTAPGINVTIDRVSFTVIKYIYSNFIGPDYFELRASTDGFATFTPVKSIIISQYWTPIDGTDGMNHHTPFELTGDDLISAMGTNSFESITFRLTGGLASHAVSYGGLANSTGFALGVEGQNLLIKGSVSVSTLDSDGDGSVLPDDCDDNDNTVYPGAQELCDGKDNDCDGLTDEDLFTFYFDFDEDGYGDPAITIQGCTAPLGYSDNNEDCNDLCSECFPGNPEVFDSLDNDCDGQVDDGFTDTDGDGIYDILDTQSLVFSSDFNDTRIAGSNLWGQIIDRAGHEVQVTTGEGILIISVDTTGGSSPAMVSIMNDIELEIDPGTTMELSPGSVKIKVISGTALVGFVDDGGNIGSTTLESGNDVTIESTTLTVTNNGSTTLTVSINNQEITIDPGETVTPSVDADGDGIEDCCDNCINKANTDQRDTDGDGYGNICDADLNNDGYVNFGDLAALKSVFGTSDEDADLNGDGYVNFGDLAILKSYFGQQPGPSGTAP